MEDSSTAYELLVELLATDMPEVAAEVRAEVAQGRPVSASRIAVEDRKLRQQRLTEQDLGRIGKGDVAVEPYDSDGRLIVLLEALQTLASSMAATRKSLEHFGRRYGLQPPYVAFADPDETAPLSGAITIGTEAVRERLDQTSAVLTAAIRAVQDSA